MKLRAKAMRLFLLGLVRLLTGAQARWYGCPPNAEHVSLHQKGRVKSAQERENIAAAKRGRKRGLNGEWL